MTILVDSREPKHIPAKLRAMGIEVKVRELEVGDYQIGESLVIERKTIDDFISSVQNKRLYEQLYMLSKSCDKPLLYLIGVYPRRPPLRRIGKRLVPVDLDSFLRTQKVISYYSFKVPVIHVGSENDFIKDLLEYYKKSNKPAALRPVKAVKRERTIEEITFDVLSCIPRIGRKTAACLASNYKLSEIVSMSREELVNLNVNGRKLGKGGERIYNVFHT